MATLKSRILAGIGANLYGQIVTVLIQLASLPLYLASWDAGRYGTWLMLAAIPSYFSMTDAGIINAARNEMTMAIGRHDHDHANQVFQSALVFLLLTLVLVSGALALVLLVLADTGVFEGSYGLTLFLLVTGILLAFFNGLSEACLSAAGLYGLGTLMGHTLRLAEWGGGLAGLLISGSYVSVAGGMLGMRLLGVLVSIGMARRSAPMLKWGFSHASMQQFRHTIRPALYFLVLPLANALSMQGFTLLVGSTLGAVSVTVFNTYRTLARLIVQATGILSLSVGPELSRLFGASEHGRNLALFRRAQWMSGVLVLGTSLVVALSGGWILEFWTHGRIPYISQLLWAMLLYAAVVGLGHVPKTLLMSINRHSVIAVASVLAYAASLLLTWLAGAQIGLTGTVMMMTGGELVLMVLAVYLAEAALRNTGPRLVAAL